MPYFILFPTNTMRFMKSLELGLTISILQHAYSNTLYILEMQKTICT